MGPKSGSENMLYDWVREVLPEKPRADQGPVNAVAQRSQIAKSMLSLWTIVIRPSSTRLRLFQILATLSSRVRLGMWFAPSQLGERFSFQCFQPSQRADE